MKSFKVVMVVKMLVWMWMAVTDVIEVCDDDSGKIDSVDGGVDCDVDFSEDGGKDGVKVEGRTDIEESLSWLKIFYFQLRKRLQNRKCLSVR